MTVEFNMEIAVRNIIACRRRAKPQDVAHGIAWYAEAYEECRQIAEKYDLPSHCSRCGGGAVAQQSLVNQHDKRS